MPSERVQHAFLSQPGEGQLLVMSSLRLRAGSAQTGGAFEVIEIEGPGSPPPHVHRDHNECFYVIQGAFTFTLGAEVVEAPAGSVVFIPHGTPHAFKQSEGARALLFVVPAQL